MVRLTRKLSELVNRVARRLPCGPLTPKWNGDTMSALRNRPIYLHANCGQTASVSGKVHNFTSDSLYELTNALSNHTTADPLYGHLFPKIKAPTPNPKFAWRIMTKTVSVEWVLLTGYRYQPMPYIISSFPGPLLH